MALSCQSRGFSAYGVDAYLSCAYTEIESQLRGIPMNHRIFSEYLRRKGLRATHQRVEIFRHVASRKGHFTPEGLHRELTDRGVRVSRATVYRTLTHLLNARLLREAVNVDGEVRFEPARRQGHHDHLVCLSCGKVIEFASPGIESLQRKVCSRHHFDPIEHTLQIVGYCSECRESRKRGAKR